METLIVKSKNNKQLTAIKAVLRALDVNFTKSDESPYNPEFVAKIKRGDEASKVGKGRKVALEELDNLWK